ncbi:hypothetical protein HMPREF9065_00613 [Aggregatibacter sp. oral taxon 458 str. W10330]|nr:hypothetical protein HMPREF9065_00613 [Aggregatibacter sp. oral taxon 458 str. W10330]
MGFNIGSKDIALLERERLKNSPGGYARAIFLFDIRINKVIH